ACLSPPSFHPVAGFVLVAIFTVSGLLLGPDAEPGQIEPVSSFSLAAYLLASTIVVLASGHDAIALMTYAALVAATIAISWRAEAATAAGGAAALAALVVFPGRGAEF